MTRQIPPPSDLAHRWAHDPTLCFLNHGSFGGCPKAVLEAQREYRDLLEAEPVRFFVELEMDLLDRARSALAPMLRADPADLVFTTNATTAVATILESTSLSLGDEILLTSQEYAACRHNVERWCVRRGVTISHAPLPLPMESEDHAFDAVMRAVTPRTRLALISHVTSPGGMVLPAERIARALGEHGIDTLIDGAHGIGLLQLDVPGLGCAWYTTNCHKWLCAPKGAALLWARPDKQEALRPLVLSNFAHSGLPDRRKLHVEFDYTGTSDPTAWIAAGDAVDILAGLAPGGWDEIMSRNRALALRGRDVICRALGRSPIVPDSMTSAMAIIPLPPHPPASAARLAARPTRYTDALQDALISRHHIQVPVHAIGPGGPRVVRISAHLYNSPEQYEYLAEALVEELDRERSCVDH